MCRYIWKTIEEWLNDRFTQFEKKGKVELVMRACVRWLDRSMEDMFTEGLKAVSCFLVHLSYYIGYNKCINFTPFNSYSI